MPPAVRINGACKKCGTKLYLVVIGDYVDETKHDCKQVQIDNLTARVVALEDGPIETLRKELRAELMREIEQLR